MAHQINVLRDLPDYPEALLVYNADSRPSAESLSFAAKVLAAGELGSDGVCQQYGAYVGNWDSLRGWARPVLVAASLWQTRWAVAFELPRAVEALPRDWNPIAADGGATPTALRRRPAWPPRMNYVIGHGLLIRRATLRRLDGFTTRWKNEDAVLGLYLALAKGTVVPNPHLERADTPDTLRGLVVQKVVWWTGPALAPVYLRARPEATRLKGFSGWLRTAWMTAALTHHAICWLAGPTLFAAGLALTLISPGAGVACVVAFWIFVAWPSDVAARSLPASQEGSLPLKVRAYAAIGAPGMYLLHGLSAWWGLGRVLLQPITGPSNKPKTPMRADKRERLS